MESIIIIILLTLILFVLTLSYLENSSRVYRITKTYRKWRKK